MVKAQLTRLAALLSHAAPYLAAGPPETLQEMTAQALAHLDRAPALTPAVLDVVDMARALQRLRAYWQRSTPT